MAEIQHLIQIAAEPAKVYELIATEGGLERWWTADVEADEHVGGTVHFGFFERATVYTMTIDALSPGSEVRWTCTSGEEWKGTRLRFSLEPQGDGTRLRFRHTDWREASDYFWTCNTTWGELMYRLKAAAEGQEPGPLFTRTGLAHRG